MQITLPKWDIAELTGYEPITSFWQDFSIADMFGADAVQDTYNRAFAEWHTNVKFITELSLVLNYKIWQHHDTAIALRKRGRDTGIHDTLGRLYDKLWRGLEDWVKGYYDEDGTLHEGHLTGEDMHYYWETTD